MVQSFEKNEVQGHITNISHHQHITSPKITSPTYHITNISHHQHITSPTYHITNISHHQHFYPPQHTIQKRVSLIFHRIQT